MKRIVLASNSSWYLYNFRAGTIAAFLGQGHEVICLAPEDEFSQGLNELGARYIPLPMHADGTNLLQELLLIWRMFRILRREQPDFVFNFTVKLNVYLGLIARYQGIPYANNVSGLGTVFLHPGFLFRQVQRIYGWANAGAKRVFFQNINDLDTFLAKGLVTQQKAVLIPGSGVNVKHFAYTPLPARPFRFLMIARLMADKGAREFVHAAGIVKRQYPDTEFALLGPDEVRNRSAIPLAEVARWRREGIVEFPGAVFDVRPWLMDSHVLVLPSYREGMPKSVLEAAAMGRPAIVTDVPGCRQSIVDGETGWLCRVRDADSLAAQMIAVMQSDVDIGTFGKRALERVRRDFSETAVIGAYLDCASVQPANDDSDAAARGDRLGSYTGD